MVNSLAQADIPDAIQPLADKDIPADNETALKWPM